MASRLVTVAFPIVTAVASKDVIVVVARVEVPVTPKVELRVVAPVTLSVLDIKSPAVWEGDKDITSHWCLAHYLIDGHHKAYTAAISDKPLTLVSFLSMNQGISSEDEIVELIGILNET